MGISLSTSRTSLTTIPIGMLIGLLMSKSCCLSPICMSEQVKEMEQGTDRMWWIILGAFLGWAIAYIHKLRLPLCRRKLTLRLLYIPQMWVCPHTNMDMRGREISGQCTLCGAWVRRWDHEREALVNKENNEEN